MKETITLNMLLKESQVPMTEVKKFHILEGEKVTRTAAFYDSLMRVFCGPVYKNNMRPQHRPVVREFLKGHTTGIVTGTIQNLACFRTEVFNIILHNHLSAVRTNDTELVKLNFHELGELPDTTIENFMELVNPDFLWLDLCTTKNVFIAHQILLLMTMRMEANKRTIIQLPTMMDKQWSALYESNGLNDFLQQLVKDGHFMNIGSLK